MSSIIKYSYLFRKIFKAIIIVIIISFYILLQIEFLSIPLFKQSFIPLILIIFARVSILKIEMSELLHKASNELVKKLEDKISAIALFGSWARGEASEHSDMDFFVVVKNFNDKDRRFQIYHQLHKVLKRDITIIDIDENNLFKEDLIINPLLLNIAWDSIILYDPSGKLNNLFKRIKDSVKNELERYRTKDGKYGWKPKNKHFGIIKV